MAIDIEDIRMLPAQEVNKIVIDLNVRLEESINELKIVETKLKKAIHDDGSKPSDIGILISYRNELRQYINQIKSELKMIDMLQSGGSFVDPATSAAASISGAGTVYFRNVNENTKKIYGAKTYGEILDDNNKEQERLEILEISEKLKKAQEFLRMEESRKQPISQKQHSQTSKI